MFRLWAAYRKDRQRSQPAVPNAVRESERLRRAAEHIFATRT
jgi:hypothetical protein